MLWGGRALPPGLRLPVSISVTSLVVWIHFAKKIVRPTAGARLKIVFTATVRALTPQGGEIALGYALLSTKPVQTIAGCLHPSAAAIHIPVVALPTGRICEIVCLV